MLKNRTIFLVDAEEKTRECVKSFLEKEGAFVLVAGNGREALEQIREKESTIDLILMDIQLAEYDGWTVCREVRKRSQIPIVIQTGRINDFDEIFGLEIGADDYLKKPVNMQVLKARINSVLRRTKGPDSSKICCHDLIIDTEKHVVKVCGNEISLSPKEYNILILLMKNKGKIVTREELLRAVWGYYYYGGLRTVDTHMNRLRIKLGDCGAFIQTIRGFGYRLNVQEKEDV